MSATRTEGGTPRIVLASGSPRRRELLTLIGIPHEVRPANVDEGALPAESPATHCERLAWEKARAVSRELGAPDDVVVLAADTIVVVDNEILGKPRDVEHARAMLRRLAGRTHEVFTAVAVARGARVVSRVDRVEVTFRALEEVEISDYVATGEPMDKAGAYGIQGYGATLVRRISGDYYAVMGLGLVTVVELLREVGVEYRIGGVQ